MAQWQSVDSSQYLKGCRSIPCKVDAILNRPRTKDRSELKYFKLELKQANLIDVFTVLINYSVSLVRSWVGENRSREIFNQTNSRAKKLHSRHL